MKIRYGFVSNSSSSSFVISLSQNDRCEKCGRSDLDILDLIDSSENDGTGVEATGLKEVLKKCNEYYGYDLKNMSNIKKKIEKESKLGNEIMLVSISYHSNTLNELLRNSKNVKIIYGEAE